MKKYSLLVPIFLSLTLLLAPGLSQARKRGQGEGQLAPLVGGAYRNINVDGVSREALIFIPKSKTATGAPLLFVFHGHGGHIRHTARNFRFQELWPEAMVIYLQGLTGVSGKTDPSGVKPGWQKNPGDQNNRDLKLFDVALAQAQTKVKIDPKRIYLFGFSNGAMFSHVIWNQRGDKIAAVVSSSAQSAGLIETATPRSLFMIIGERDKVAPYLWQMRSVPVAQKRLGVDVSKAAKDGYLTMATGSNGIELWTYIHPGAHEVPQMIPAKAVEFFKRHSL